METARIRGQKSEEKMTFTVSADGSWQKRGHSSLNGIVTIISTNNGKCVDNNA